MRKVSGLAAVIVAAALSACGTEGTATVVEEVRTVVETVDAAPEPEPAPVRSATADEPAREPAEPETGGTIVVPDVVGEDHQLAQDTMQAAGLYDLREEDATGQDRLLLYDRNWTVVSQDPPAGRRVGPDTTVTLSSKKDDE